jgi:predicted metalloprotease with PDZ domain
MIRLVRALTMAPACGALVFTASNALAQCRFADASAETVWTYRFQTEFSPNSLVLHVTVQLPVGADGRASLQLPAHWAGQTLHALSNLRALSEGTLDVDPKGDAAELHGPPNRVATIAYDLKKDWTGPLVHPLQFHPVLMPDYFEFTGNNALVFPQLNTREKLAATIMARFDFQQLPAAWALATSFGTAESGGDRCQVAAVPAIDIVHALFAAGDFRLRPFLIGRRAAVLAVRGAWTFSDDDAIAQIQKVVGVVRDFWKDDQFPYFLVTLKPYDRDSGSSDGSAFTNAFWMYVSRQDSFAGLLPQLAHEAFHAWNPARMGVGPTIQDLSWFTEGFTDYYASRLMLQAGALSPSAYVDSLNQALRRFPASTNPYVRGRVIGLWLDAAIRRESRDQRSLDDVMFDLVRTRDQSLTTQRLFNTIANYVSAETLATLRVAAADQGALSAPDRAPHLGSCAQPSSVELPTFDLGFDLPASRAAGKIVGVKAQGPAYAAGLRDGQVLSGRVSVSNNDPDRLALFTIRDDAGVREISFYPRGPMVQAWQYRMTPDCRVDPR